MSQFTVDQPVTVTLTDGNGEEHVFDGFVTRNDLHVITDMSRPYHQHTPVDAGRYEDARRFVVIESVAGVSFGHDHDKWRVGRDHLFVDDNMWVAVEGTTTTIRPADEQALTRIDAALSPKRRVAKAVATIAETDPAAAEALREAVDDLTDAAFDRGVAAASYDA